MISNSRPTSAIAYTNKAVIYRLLFELAAETLGTIAADPKHLGAQIGVTLVLHTWGSALTHHPHVHGIVPGGGLSPDGERWVACKPGFFLHRAGQLQFFGEFAPLADAMAFADWLAPLRTCEWVVYAKRPFAGPAAVLAYLSRYTHRVAISNQRLIALDERGVSFRWKDYRAKGRSRHKTMTLAAEEFMRRFLLHVLPGGFHRIRHYGLFANAGPGASRQSARTAARRPRRSRSAAALRARSHRRAHLRLPALWCGDDHRGDLRPPPIDPCAANIIASCSMSTGIGDPKGAPALRRPAPIADGFALRCHKVDSRLLRHPRLQPCVADIRHPRNLRLRSSGAIALSGRTANHQIPIAL